MEVLGGRNPLTCGSNLAVSGEGCSSGSQMAAGMQDQTRGSVSQQRLLSRVEESGRVGRAESRGAPIILVLSIRSCCTPQMAAATATATAAASLLLSLSLPGGASRSPPPAPAAFLRYSASAAKQHLQLAVVFLAAAPFSGGARSSRKRRCSAAGSSSAAVSSEKWVLEPAGDGDWRHIGYRVARPGAIEIPTSGAVVTVGRVAEKADVVVPVATVSGVHARLEAKDDGSLAVTDMDSTNGTYINERKLVPGFAVTVNPGSLLIFGDIHLAMFRVTKVVVDVPVTPAATGAGDDEEEDVEAKTEVVSVAEETSS